MALKGNYDGSTSYSVGDIVKYTDGVFYHLQKPAAAGTTPVETRCWGRLDQDMAQAAQMAMDLVGSEDNVKTSDVSNSLTVTSKGKVLDARQGKALKDLVDAKVATADVANALDVTAEGKVLDARQGKALKDLIDALTLRVAALEPEPEPEPEPETEPGVE